LTEEYKGNGIKRSDVTEVVDLEEDSSVLLSWYEEASEVDNPEGFTKLSKRLLGTYSLDEATTPHAVAAIALAALKMADKSEQGKLTSAQWTKVMWIMVQSMMGTEDEPLRIMRFSDLLSPQGWGNYCVIPPDVWEWMKVRAKEMLEDTGAERVVDDATKDHLTCITKGEIPFGLCVN
jgi:hypothetical protein